MRFAGKTALITGAAVGIGRATAVKLASEGAKVVALDLNEEKLKTLKEEIESKGGEALTLICDVSDERAVGQAFEQAKKAFGTIHILVNNAALWRDFTPFLETKTEFWKTFMDINVMGVVHCTRAALPDMIEAGYGRIVNVASVAGVYGNANMVCYSATKGAVIAMTRALAKEVADKGVLVNAVSPGTVTSSECEDYDLTMESAVSYMKRTGSDMENANLICFFASDEASYISGQNLQIDGCRKKI
jgi:NAD(P)-dependent dehydrogenase (short-subunit alcohol dehydrogenase family)